MTTNEGDRIDKGIEEPLNAEAEGQVEGQVKEKEDGEGERREEQGEERVARSPELSEHSKQSSSPSSRHPLYSSRFSRRRYYSSRDQSFVSSEYEFSDLLGRGSGSEEPSEESDPESLGDSIEVSDEIGEADSSEAVADLANFLNIRFRSHRKTLQSELRQLEDNTKNRLYSDPEIQREFTAKAATTPAASTAGKSACDTTFGYRAIVGLFSIPTGRHRTKPVGFQYEKVSMACIAKHLAEFDRSHQKSIAWVHLPVNNLLWVQVCTVYEL